MTNFLYAFRSEIRQLTTRNVKLAENLEVPRIVHFGGDRGIRTPDLCDANAALSQLSYIPTGFVYYQGVPPVSRV